MFGENEMEDGDQVTISINRYMFFERECGVSFVYDDGKNEKEEDPLSYYKSWNHIIGGDLSPFQLATQKYELVSFIAHGAFYNGRTQHTWPRNRAPSTVTSFVDSFILRCNPDCSSEL
ncbi:hypothetical protein Tco_1271913 [Tanacetum coccineum]